MNTAINESGNIFRNHQNLAPLMMNISKKFNVKLTEDQGKNLNFITPKDLFYQCVVFDG
ncbi:hypothetical protein SAMN05421544_11030 [Riemerella columbipharyngis]|uniref:Uncharacterized protein n=1 Tax=Riemerella columbipharyngis TaxID=1071918 RepID=A0A1G7D6M2_9FLAO|nr:hypothetical protein SAMN05421544_11030 [Riemerella columbipharyngis]